MKYKKSKALFLPSHIFIQIASYRDPELLPTMRDAVAKAAHPENLTFGICYQGSADSAELTALKSIPHCSVIQMDPQDAKGTCYARSLTQSLWQGEEYTLQIDSHARFVPEWDTQLQEMLRVCGEKAVLTTYCPPYIPNEAISPHPVARTLGADYFTAYGSLMLLSRFALATTARPVPGAFWSGHFSFSKATLIEDVPYDPKLYFHGEEITYAVRAWTSGYNLFYPNRAVCYHYYQREGRSTHWDDYAYWFSMDMLSQQRVRRLLGIESGAEDFGRYGLGTARTLQEYEEFSGINFAGKHISAKAHAGFYGEIPPLGMIPPKNSPPDQNILFVTSFLEMGRGKWTDFGRERSLYLEWFSMLVALKNIQLVCYYDEQLQHELPPGRYFLRNLDLEDTFFREHLETEQEIICSREFRDFICARRTNPEHCHPEYSIMTHSKANFLRRAAEEFPEYSHYAWIDFGIARRPMYPSAVFDWRRLMDNKIHIQVFAPPVCYPSDPRTLCQASPDAVSASLFVVPRELIDWYEAACERELFRNHAEKICDDEQNSMLRMAQSYPDKISADLVNDWYDFFYDSICGRTTME